MGWQVLVGTLGSKGQWRDSVFILSKREPLQRFEQRNSMI